MIWPFTPNKHQPSASELVFEVKKHVEQFGYELTPHGIGVALLSIESGYSAGESASHVILLSIARDAKSAYQNLDTEATKQLNQFGQFALKILNMFKDAGYIRSNVWEKDTTAIGKIIFPSPESTKWIEKVLSNPVVAKEAVTIPLMS